MSGIIRVLNSKKWVKLFNIHGFTKNFVIDCIYIYMYMQYIHIPLLEFTKLFLVWYVPQTAYDTNCP